MYAFAAIFFMSCSQDELTTYDIDSEEQVSKILKNYASSQVWENKQTVKLKSGITVNTPWSSNVVQTNIPKATREDIKSVDGWVFVYSNLDATSGKDNYIIFYNRFTGILKGFYYLEEQNQQNNGMWKIEFEGGLNKLLNGADYFTVPITSIYSSPIWLNSFTITTNSETRGFEKGWNAFQAALTYDASYNMNSLRLKVSPYNNNSTKITLTGELSTASNGSMISTTTSSSADGLLTKVKDGMVTQAGTEATSWIGSKITKGVIKKGGSSILTGGVSSLVTAGVDFLFGSFFGKKTETTTTTNTTLEFTTKGSITATGNLNNNTSGLFTPLSNIPLDAQERLGSWNLSGQPTLTVGCDGFLISSMAGKYEYQRFLTTSEVNVVVNPYVLSLIDKYEVSTSIVYYKKLNGSANWNSDSRDDSKLMNKQEQSLGYDDGETIIYGPIGYIQCETTTPPLYPAGGRPYCPDKSLVKNNFVVKVRVTMYPKAPYDKTPIVTTRSYIPKVAYK